MTLKWLKIAKVGGIGDRGMHVFTYGAAVTNLGHKKRMFYLKKKKRRQNFLSDLFVKV